MGLSVVTVVGLAHGIERANDPQRRLKRMAFVEEVIRDVPIHAVDLEIAVATGNLRHFQLIPGLTVLPA
jgi:predicted nucleic acid-binding protein